MYRISLLLPRAVIFHCQNWEATYSSSYPPPQSPISSAHPCTVPRGVAGSLQRQAVGMVPHSGSCTLNPVSQLCRTCGTSLPWATTPLSLLAPSCDGVLHCVPTPRASAAWRAGLIVATLRLTFAAQTVGPHMLAASCAGHAPPGLTILTGVILGG